MISIDFLVKGSAPEPYEVQFAYDGHGNIKATCTCPAGALGQSCKHRLNILKGTTSNIISVSSGDIDHAVATVTSWLPGSDIEKAMTEISELEDTVEKAKKALLASKKKFARLLQ